MREIRTEQDFETLLEESNKRPQILLKHSTRCGVSRIALNEFERFAEKDHRAELWTVLVVENREVSLKIAEESGVEHQSPQVIIFKDGKAVWSGSHYAITAEAIGEKLSEA